MVAQTAFLLMVGGRRLARPCLFIKRGLKMAIKKSIDGSLVIFENAHENGLCFDNDDGTIETTIKGATVQLDPDETRELFEVMKEYFDEGEG